jgi:hypothetical protein
MDTKNWVKNVKTVTVDVPPGTMKQSPKEIAKILLTKNTYPGAPGSINRFIQFYINRAGKSLSEERLTALKRAQEIIRKSQP